MVCWKVCDNDMSSYVTGSPETEVGKTMIWYMSSYVTGSPEIEVGKTMIWFVGKSVTMICRRM